jgi:dTDP-4-dehydrorhamnose 3,5-epimerase
VTFGKYIAAELSSENARQLFIPRGFAHGYLVLEDNTLFSYKCDNFYNPESERGLKFDDPKIGIKWPKLNTSLVLSQKDQNHPYLFDIEPYEENGDL